MCCGYSKELSQRDGSFEQAKHMPKIMGKIFLQFYAENICLSKPTWNVWMLAWMHAPLVALL